MDNMLLNEFAMNKYLIVNTSLSAIHYAEQPLKMACDRGQID